MKKVKILSFASLPLAMALLAGCGHEHTFAEEWTKDANKHWHAATCEHKDQVKDEGSHVDDDHNGKCDVCDYEMPAPVSGEVTADEWVAAFGLKKPFYIADNYKLVATMSTEGQSQNAELIVDGLKLQANEKEGDVVETTYNEISGDKKYEYEYNSETKKWSKKDVRETIADDFAQYLQPYGENYSSFAYNAESKSYKCSSITYKGQAFTNLEIKFENKQIKEAKFDSAQEGHPMSMVFAFTYGGQVVNLPKVEPVVGERLLGYKINDNAYMEMNHNSKNDQWEINDIGLFQGDKITFANLSASLKEPAPLTTLYSESQQGFEFNEGELTCTIEGVYGFIITPEETKDRITIIKQDSPEPVSDVKLMGSFDEWSTGYSMLPKEEGSTEYVAEGIFLNAGDKIKVKEGIEDSGYCEIWKNGGTNNAIDMGYMSVDEDKNAIAIVDLAINVYYESAKEGGQGFGTFVEFLEVTSPYTATGTYQDQTSTLNLAFDKIENGYAQYFVNIPEGYVNKALVYAINKDGGIIEVDVEPVDEGVNFIKQADNTFKYIGEATTLNLYFKVYLDGRGYGLYVGNASTPIDDSIPKTLTLKDDQHWAFEDPNVVIFAWVWGPLNDGSWINVNYEVGATSTVVNVPADTTGLLLVRCPKGTVTPDWNIKSGDEPGRIYNKTSNVVIGTPDSYEVNFMDYPLPE